ncbi:MULTISPECIES: conjugative transposon protein TraM [Flavobacteriaceae]|uniref:Conjugative transposon protein TraM n=1 Tax=Winogradskyella endarachnes TaxID=2681965 RepID=A0A6L6UD22_9FLAO|nr:MULTISPECIES: conjugative transposon protein TraM [Flavobacteriaceae]MDO6818446.1 conjugative transposon protein TraM [Zobellia sp. 1_MG-2023]MUU78664.1 conjugative transposon protein TraM [Winogradskyella endarachnes]
MKLEKNKIVFAAVLAVIFIFLISYSMMVMGDDESENENLEQTLVPDLDENQKEYDSKLDAINDLKEVRENNAPSIYDEKLLDSTGLYNPDLPELEKERIVDSIYNAGKIQYSDKKYRNLGQKKVVKKSAQQIDSAEIKREQKIQAKELGLEHQLFFAASPKPNEVSIIGNTDEMIYVVVDGDQVVKANTRLRMRLTKSATINGKLMPKNTPVFGFISFQPNRALIEIENIKHHPTKLKAFDLLDGSEGIYVENNFRAEATTEVLDDVIGDINIPTVPQVGGITQVFRRRNRSVKVTVLNNYKLILKPKL